MHGDGHQTVGIIEVKTLRDRQVRFFQSTIGIGIFLQLLLGGCGPAERRDRASTRSDSSAKSQESATADSAQPPSTRTRRQSDQAFAPLREAKIPELRFELRADLEQRLRENPRRYVRASFRENDQPLIPAVGLKLKGAAGSFREFDDKPAMTIKSSRFQEGLRFHGMDKWHLNNSVQDESYLCELIASEICREAGIPAPRVAHARVWLNDRDLGLYVVKEGFDEAFLARHFDDPKGNLYDGGFLQDIDVDLEKDSEGNPDDRQDLQALREACMEPDAVLRWERIEASLDVEAFLRFMAFELLACHWDGYSLAKNNYRIYFNPADGRARFLPHGMDQTFGDPNFPIYEFPETMVAGAVMRNPAWRQRYREIVEEMRPLFAPDRWLPEIERVRQRIQESLRDQEPEVVQQHRDRVQEFRDRLIGRSEALQELVGQPDPQPLAFDDSGKVAIVDWYPVQESEDAMLTEAEQDGRRLLTLAVGPSADCVASWRSKLLLSGGMYTLEVRLKTREVEPRDDPQGRGAGPRISGAMRVEGLVGDHEWTTMQYDFQVDEPLRPIELVVELRATRGQVWLDAEATLLRRSAADPNSEPRPEGLRP